MKPTLCKLLLTVLVAMGIAGPATAARVTIAQSLDPQSLWPNATTSADTYNAGTPIVESLFWLDASDNQIKPLLALSYTQDSPNQITIKLRPNVKFTNGEPMNADAVIFSYNVVTDPKQTPAYTRYFEGFSKITKIDNLTVQVDTSYPLPPMGLTLSLFFVVPPKYWTEVGGAVAFGRKPIGTGPFTFHSWVRDAQVVLKRNDAYWGKLPENIDELVFKSVPDFGARVAGAITGEVDIAKQVPISSVADLRKRVNLKVLEVNAFTVVHLILSSLEQHKSPLQDKRVRHAINFAIDKQGIIDGLFLGNARRLNGQLLRPTQPGYDPNIVDYPYDPKKAKQLLTEAGYPNGFQVPFKVPVGSIQQGQEVAEAVAGMLGAIGITAKIQLLEAGEYLRQLRARELGPMAISGNQPPDDSHFMMSQYHSTWRYSYINDAELDKLIDEGKVEMDPKKRDAIYRKISALIYEQAPVGFINGGVDHYAVNAKLKNFHPRGDGRYFFYNVSLDK